MLSRIIWEDDPSVTILLRKQEGQVVVSICTDSFVSHQDVRVYWQAIGPSPHRKRVNGPGRGGTSGTAEP